MSCPTGSPRARPTGTDGLARTGGRLRAAAGRDVLQGLELAVLTSFAVAQPLLDVLGRTPEFFVVRGWSPADVVLLAVALALVPPAALLLLEVVVQLTLGATPALAVHLVLTAGLFALFLLQLLERTAVTSGEALVVLAAAGGVLGTWLYLRVRSVRSVLAVLSPAPLLFVALFLLHSPASKLVFPGAQAAISIVAAESETPIVVIVFDEFTSVSLLNGEREIDGRRFPNFAALARTSTWYRDATTVSQGTVRAVPAIATGRYPRPDSLPTVHDHPQNAFTLFGRSHEVRAFEPVTRLCPPAICPRPDRPSARDALSSLVSDLNVVYLHLVLPDEFARDLPPITHAWGNFRGERKPRTFKERLFWDPAWAFGRFLSAVRSQRGRPPFHFAHLNLPHAPYRYLPSGASYTAPLPGLEHERWSDDPWPAVQGHQRYVLQLGYVDRLLGTAIAKLRATGLFERSVLVVTADHGVSFRPHQGRRAVNAVNYADIAFVPLFVKAPGQRRGQVRRGLVRSIDILPTIAELAHVAVPWRTDGRSLLAGPSRRGAVRVDGYSFGVGAAYRARAAAFEEHHRLFGEGDWRSVFLVGPNAELVGRRLDSLSIRPGDELGAELDSDHSFVARRGRSAPSFVAGRLSGKRGASAPSGLALAVAVNGAIAAVCRSYSDRGETRFSALVPESAFDDGGNRVEVLAVSSTGSGVRLTRVGGAG